MKKISKIVFFGNEKLATGLDNVRPLIQEAIVGAGFDIEQHVTGPISELQPHKAELAVLAAYGHIIPQRILDEFPLGIINIHPSLLPLYRGSTPIEQAILDGATKTGVSIMQLTAGMDEGPVYKQKTVPLSGQETKIDLAQKLQQLGAELLVEVLPAIASGKLKPRQQSHPDRATYSKRITKEDGHIDWRKPAEKLEREVRAFAGWPKSPAKMFNMDISITKASVATGWGSPSGTVAVDFTNSTIKVQCKHSALSIEQLIPSGRGLMTAKEFLNGYNSRVLHTPRVEILG